MEMLPRTGDDAERTLREAYEPDAATVTRVIAGALAAKPRRWPALRIVAPIVAAALVLVCLLLLYQPSPTMADDIRLEYLGGVALLQAPDGTSWVITSDGEREDPGLNLIIVEGEK
jgi:hypothetical protein